MDTVKDTDRRMTDDEWVAERKRLYSEPRPQIPGPQSLETYQLVHGHKPPDPKSKEEQIAQLIDDFRNKLDSLVASQNDTDNLRHINVTN